MNIVPFEAVARLPASADNVAIATRTLSAGTRIQYGAAVLTVSHTVLLGHRFAVRPVAMGEALRSWEQTFGLAIQPIGAGDYICNVDVLGELQRRTLNIDLPASANFQNELEPYHFDEIAFQPAAPLPRYAEVPSFMGYLRGGGRGVGTRNTIILLATSSVCSGFVRTLETRLKDQVAAHPTIDGVVAIAHTEGGHGHANNQELLLRTLAGFGVHPNVSAVLIVDYGQEAINNPLLQDYLRKNDYPMDAVIHHYMSLSQSFEADLTQAETIVSAWVAPVSSMTRTPQPLSALKLALQCGGSDAFSGISGNPLAAWVAKEVIQYGGAANLAETDELIGAENYVLNKVRDRATAQKFLHFVERFKQRAAWHGHSADGNPSGGNKYRGLYNIYLKSLGAATKRHPDVPLDFVIEYSEPMRESGYYFMDSPGNDLESIAGQVASGCNMILFITGNGSITNFPFVPTIKIVTTTERYELLKQEMDINAGAYLDGTPLETVGEQAFAYTVEVAAGRLSVGEKAGHSQVQIWRDWRLTRSVDIEPLQNPRCTGQPIPIRSSAVVPQVSIPIYRNGAHITSQLVGLVMPTSLCSGQIARLAVDTLNKQNLLAQSPVSRFVTLVHTEGCGSSGNVEFKDTLMGYLAHPFVRHTLLLEHGCESTHNDYFRQALRERGYDPQAYGWASIQLDGGIQKVIQKIHDWFALQLAHDTAPEPTTAGLEAFRIALVSHTIPTSQATAALTHITRTIVGAGGSVIVHEQDTLWQTEYRQQLGLERQPEPSLSYAQPISVAGFHVMHMPTRDWGEILTGVGAAGVELIVSMVAQPMPGHPMIPVLQVAPTETGAADMVLSGSAAELQDQLLTTMIATLEQRYVPKTLRSGNVNFQITRGLLGVSL